VPEGKKTFLTLSFFKKFSISFANKKIPSWASLHLPPSGIIKVSFLIFHSEK